MDASVRIMGWGWGEVDSLEGEIGSTGFGEQQVSEIREKGSSTVPRVGLPLSREHRPEAG